MLYNVKHLLAGPLGNHSFCFPHVSMFLKYIYIYIYLVDKVPQDITSTVPNIYAHMHKLDKKDNYKIILKYNLLYSFHVFS